MDQIEYFFKSYNDIIDPNSLVTISSLLFFHLISRFRLGIQQLLYDNKTEHLRQINALYRFNIYQEVLLASLYRFLDLKVSRCSRVNRVLLQNTS